LIFQKGGVWLDTLKIWEKSMALNVNSMPLI